VRFDGGIAVGQAITPAFDSMLAKLVVHGATRDEAAARLATALAELTLLGVPTNIDYLRRVVTHPQFLAGHLHTGFLTQHAASLQPVVLAAEAAAAAVAALLAEPAFRQAAFDVPEPYASIGAWCN
jgi:propionyl-CoA carboxylase alpha chain/3-methylcrotonyl-CoA carboxylase alpha subunit/acetyl-CoA/propionyl-CoA carboxylase biotin carboxyl carrier protein